VPGATRVLFILDACVLIDFLDADPGLFQRVARHLGLLIIPSPLLKEVGGADPSFFRKHGVKILDPTMDQLVRAAAKRGGLSFADHLCLLMAQDDGYTCVTNDRALRNACKAEGVEAVRGLKLVLDLVEAGGLSHTEAVEISRTIHRANPMHINEDVLVMFDRLLGLIPRG
jgi:predicted nucleic acid-binding protein